jgi:hypothetical protein
MCTFEDHRVEQARAEAFEAGRKAERAEIVRWIRREYGEFATDRVTTIERCASEIEAGEHAEDGHE